MPFRRRHNHPAYWIDPEMPASLQNLMHIQSLQRQAEIERDLTVLDTDLTMPDEPGSMEDPTTERDTQ